MTQTLIKKHGIVFSEENISRIMVNNSIDILNEICNNKHEITILEPSVGKGDLLIELLKYIPSTIKVNIDCLDINNNFLKQTKNSLNNYENLNIRYLNIDYLDYLENKKYDIIISNPPYVRTSVIGAAKSKTIKESFGLSGKIDLYHAFFAKMIDELVLDGLIIIITSNKYLYNKTGNSICKKIINNINIDTLIDLGDTKLFDAAVLPAILIGRKKSKNKTCEQFFSIYENYANDHNKYAKKVSCITDAISNSYPYFIYNNKYYNLRKGKLRIKKDKILLITKDEQEFINKIIANSTHSLKDIASVKVGIKSTADKVFISTRFDVKIESELIHPIIISKSIHKWKVNNDKRKSILYPYDFKENIKKVISLDDYPYANKYLVDNQKILKARTYVSESNKKWFEIWVSHTPKLWKSEKIVFKDIASSGTFAYDIGSIVNGDSYMIILNDNIPNNYLFLLLGILNSSVLSRYHEIMFPNKLYSNKKRFNSQYLHQYPILDINNKYSKKIISIVKEIIFGNINNITNLENEINILCEKAYLSN